jgi:hypothetical protein
MRPISVRAGLYKRISAVAVTLGLGACVETLPALPPEPRDHPPVVAFSPAVAQQFRRPLGRMFGARPVMTQAEYEARNAGAAGLPKAAADPEVIAAFLGDRTVLTYSPQHGTQVEYISKSGEVFLWYPGNSAILPGSLAVLWENASAEIDDPQEGRYRGQVKLSHVCFRYGANTYNPASGQRGGGFECSPYSSQRERVKETRKGDVFDLAGRSAAPFPLGREPQSIAALQKRVGAVRP